MRLTGFRVTNFRSVVDSGWITASAVNALIGVNESGKSNLLLPLWKLNPARDGDIQPTSDYPKTQYASIKDDPKSVVFIEAEFLAERLGSKIAELTGRPVTEVECCRVTRSFSGDYSVSFPGCTVIRTSEPSALRSTLENARKELDGMAGRRNEVALKAALLQAIDDAIATLDTKNHVTFEAASEISNKIISALSAFSDQSGSLRQRYTEMIEEIEEMKTCLDSTPPEDVDGVSELIIRGMPKFVYYSNYGNLDSEIYLPHVVENLGSRKLGSREEARARTLRTLFSFVRLKPEEILELGQEVEVTGSPPISFVESGLTR